MRYPEKENFRRVVQWDSPSHVCYPTPSRGICYHGAWPADVRPSPAVRQWQDIWGVTWTDMDGELFPTGPAVASIDDLDRLPRPDPHAQGRFDKVRQFAAAIDRREQFFAVSHPYFLYEKGFNLLGAEEFLASLAGRPADAERLLDIIIDFELGAAQEYAALKPDHVTLSDDYGMQDRLAVSPAMWRRLFKPRLKRVIDLYRGSLGPAALIGLHSCGHVMPILEDLIEIGIQVLNPIQTTANDLPEMRRRTAGRLVLCGGIDGQQVLPLGTSEDVRGEVFRKLDLLWEGGGYLPAAEKMLGVPPANVQAMEQAIRDWSRQNVETA
jgi:uroporphyrinogen decarboxylase